MANVQIPMLPRAIVLNGNEPIEAVQAGQSVQINPLLIAKYIATLSPGIFGNATGWQLQMALVNQGQYYNIQSAIPSDPTNFVTIEWTTGAPIAPGSQLYTFIQSTLGYSTAQMTALITLAQTFPL
jgi:hypothetical protein